MALDKHRLRRLAQDNRPIKARPVARCIDIKTPTPGRKRSSRVFRFLSYLFAIVMLSRCVNGMLSDPVSEKQAARLPATVGQVAPRRVTGAVNAVATAAAAKALRHRVAAVGNTRSRGKLNGKAHQS